MDGVGNRLKITATQAKEITSSSGEEATDEINGHY